MSREIAIGIDFGAFSSCLAVFLNGKVKIIANSQGECTTPSYVAFNNTNQLIGDHAKMEAIVNPENTIFGIKKMIGCSFDDVQPEANFWPFKVINDNAKPKIEVQFKGETTTYSPDELSSMILANMKSTAEKYLGKTVTDAVITVPACYSFSQCQAIKDIGKDAGLKVLRVMKEPVAATLAYGFAKKITAKRNILAFDLGSCNLNVSITRIDNGTFAVKSVATEGCLGGDYFDNRLINYFLQKFKRKNKNVETNIYRLRIACEEAKRRLSLVTETDVVIDCLCKCRCIGFCTRITRECFEDLCVDLFEKIIKLVEKCLRDAKMKPVQIDEIILTGGSSQIPKVEELLQNIFRDKVLNKSINPDKAAAYGAAIQAALLQGNVPKAFGNFLVRDVVPLPLGVEVANGDMCIVVQKNTTFPIDKTVKFRTFASNQTYAWLKIYEGEAKLGKNNHLLGKFNIRELRPSLEGMAQFKVTFNIDIDGVLCVSAINTLTGKQNRITIGSRLNNNQELPPQTTNKSRKVKSSLIPTIDLTDDE